MSALDREQLISKFQSKQAIIGLSYVGLPLAVVFAEASFPVIGIDVDARKVDATNRGESYIEDIPSKRLVSLVQVADSKWQVNVIKLRLSRPQMSRSHLSASSVMALLKSAHCLLFSA